MTERSFADRHLGQYKIKGDEIVPKYCPYCGGGDHRDKETFALNTRLHTFNCLRGSCGKKGHFAELCKDFGEVYQDAYAPPVRREWKRPATRPKPTQSEVERYISVRGINKATAEEFGIGQDDKGNMVFPYYRTATEYEAKTPVFVKFRKPKKLEKGERKMWRESDTEPILFGMHLCNIEDGVLWIFEGEFDCMCGRQASKCNCVSVPSGCEDYTWLETCYDWLSQFVSIVVMADNDAAGKKMLQELSMKLECQVLRPDFSNYMGCKDANEIMVRHGEEQLAKAMTETSQVETYGLLNLADVRQVDIDKISRALTGIHALDNATGGMLMGDLSVWTGKRGEGKSTICTQLLLEAIDQGKSVCAYSGEIPAERFKYIVNLQAAGSRLVNERDDKATGRSVQYLPRAILDKAEAWYNGKFWLYDNRVVESDEAESIIRLFEMAYRRYDCRVFLVDNLMTVSTCRNDRDYYQLQADFTIRLRKLAEKLNAHIHLVVHPRKGEIRDGDAVGGLSTITNIACNVFSMQRVQEDDMQEMGCDAVLTCLKNRAYGDHVAVKMDYLGKCRKFVQQGHKEREFSWAGAVEPEYNPFTEA